MSNMGTFGTFTQARLGIYAAQYGFSVTGNNISNINTVGYTRQTLDQVSLRTGGADRYASKYDIRVGNGALLTGVSQIRDPYLDIRYRTECASVGYTNTMLEGLNSLAAILDEVGDNEGDGFMTAQFNDLMDQLVQMSDKAGQEEFDKLVRNSSEELCDLFHDYAKRLEELRENTETSFKQDIDTVNKLLESIRELNTSIRKSEIHGDAALELRDNRNNLIDELSQYMKINARYEMENLGAGQYVEKLIIELDDANPDPLVTTDETILVDGIYARQFELKETSPAINPKYDPTVTDTDDPAYGKYLIATSNPDYDPAYKPTDPKNLTDDDKLKMYQYLDANSDPTNDFSKAEVEGTDDPEEATQTENTNYDLKLTELRDVKNRIMKIKDTDDDGNVIYVNDEPVDLDDNDLYGAIQAKRELLTEAGEFSTYGTINGVDESASTKRGIPYYQHSLDLLARQFARQFNELNNGYAIDENGNYVMQVMEQDPNDPTKEIPVLDKDGNYTYTPIIDPVTYYVDGSGDYVGIDQTALENLGLTLGEDFFECTANFSANMSENDLQAINDYLTKDDPAAETIASTDQDAIFAYLEANGGVFMGGNLFSNSGDSNETDEITAANISVSVGWSTGAWHIVTTYQKLFGEDGNNTTQNDNQDRMISLVDKNGEITIYNPQDIVEDAKSDHLFQGSYQEMLNNMCTELGKDQRKTETMLNTYYNTAMELDVSRDGVSGVDLNDEAMNLMMYQKAYSAACRLMTTIDEALDRLINNTAM